MSWDGELVSDPIGGVSHRVSTPHYSSGLLIEKNDAYTKIYSRAGLSLMWNREDALMVGTSILGSGVMGLLCLARGLVAL